MTPLRSALVIYGVVFKQLIIFILPKSKETMLSATARKGLSTNGLISSSPKYKVVMITH